MAVAGVTYEMGVTRPLMLPDIPSLVSLKVPEIPVISKVPLAVAPDVLLATCVAVIDPELVIVPLENENVKVSALKTADVKAAPKSKAENRFFI